MGHNFLLLAGGNFGESWPTVAHPHRKKISGFSLEQYSLKQTRIFDF
jgi:hypothetical protein